MTAHQFLTYVRVINVRNHKGQAEPHDDDIKGANRKRPLEIGFESCLFVCHLSFCVRLDFRVPLDFRGQPGYPRALAP